MNELGSRILRAVTKTRHELDCQFTPDRLHNPALVCVSASFYSWVENRCKPSWLAASPGR
jgi:hypothetical protein